MRIQRLIGSVFVAAVFSFALLGCDGNDGNNDDNLCRADCGRDLAMCIRACGAVDQACIDQCLDDFDMCRDDCHDQGGGQ